MEEVQGVYPCGGLRGRGASLCHVLLLPSVIAWRRGADEEPEDAGASQGSHDQSSAAHTHPEESSLHRNNMLSFFFFWFVLF